MSPILILDGSFFCFHCYFSANKKNPHSLTMQDFAHVFFDKLQVLLNAFQPKPILCVGRDCVKKDNWRLELYKEYKARRKHIPQIGPILHHVYKDKWFEQAGASKILYHPHLEADDCIALYAKSQSQRENKIIIVSSDRDFMQLSSANIRIMDLSFRIKNNNTDPQKALQLKILMGDKSDNIPSVFPKCGIKTAQRCLEDPSYFTQKMENHKPYYDQYHLNTRLINFHYIPDQYKQEFIQSI